MPTAPRPRSDPEALLKRLEWTVLRRLDGLLHGDYRTLMRGFGLDLADLREYQYHDDVRHIDWNVTARLQMPYVREFHEERELTAWFLLDLSPSVDFGSVAKKRSLSEEFVAVLARLMTRHGNRVGALLYGDKLDTVVPARGGRRHVLELLHRLRVRPATKRPSGTTELGDFLRGAFQAIKRRSLVFVVSDFISTPGWERPLAQLAERHEVLAVRLYDPLEMDIPDIGMVLIEDAETGEQLFVDTGDAGFRKRFAETAARREAQLRTALRQAGVDALELVTGDDLVESLMRFTELRRMRTRRNAGGMPRQLRRVA
ncbi:MAG: DUF58 domain-containing protein [Betaproteobacteria bacterium]|nr:DUF58 domain-containing protein [Betaproteobacteria bacterium]